LRRAGPEPAVGDADRDFDAGRKHGDPDALRRHNADADPDANGDDGANAGRDEYAGRDADRDYDAGRKYGDPDAFQWHNADSDLDANGDDGANAGRDEYAGRDGNCHAESDTDAIVAPDEYAGSHGGGIGDANAIGWHSGCDGVAHSYAVSGGDGDAYSGGRCRTERPDAGAG
jgi:hypothetical protein